MPVAHWSHQSVKPAPVRLVENRFYELTRGHKYENIIQRYLAKFYGVFTLWHPRASPSMILSCKHY